MNLESMAEGSAHQSGQGIFEIDPQVKIGYVSLNVSDLQGSLEFYRSVLGFKMSGRVTSDRVLLKADGDSPALVELVKAKKGMPAQKRAGLYHFAILLPERSYLADMLLNLREKHDEVTFDGLADHLVSEAIYIRDPDHNGIEIYCDRPYSSWKWDGGFLQMATLPLDTENLIREGTEKGWTGMPSRTTIGHVHLHVRNLENAIKFYRDALGMNLTCRYPGAYFFAGGRYHHHVAANTWLGNGISAASPDEIGLNHLGVRLSSAKELGRLMEQLSRGGLAVDQKPDKPGSVMLKDGDDIRLKVSH